MENSIKIANNFISYIDNDKEHVTHSKSDNIKITIHDGGDENVRELFISLKNRYQNSLESKEVSLSLIIFSYCVINVIKINPNYGGSYIDSPNWIKNKKATINLINKRNNKCFQYAVTVALNNEENKKDL